MRAKADAQPDGLCTNYEQPPTCVTTMPGERIPQGGPASTGAQSVGEVHQVGLEPELLKVGDVAQMLSLGERTILRMSDAGKMPPPVKIGGSVRWSRRALRTWIDDGCPAVRALPRSR